MSEKCKTVMNIIEKLAPIHLAESWDNVGLQIGDISKDVHRIMVCLEVTEAVIDEAISKAVDMIIVHHPLLFKPVKNIRSDDPIGRMIYRLIRYDIVLYAAHTNLDMAMGGTNDALATALDLHDIRPMINFQSDKYLKEVAYDITPLENKFQLLGMGRIGMVEENLTVSLLCEKLKRILGTSHLRVIGDVNKSIKQIGLCTGSGAEFILDAYKAGCDCYITGDVRYHEAQHALQLGMTVIDAGHYETENFACKFIADYLVEVIAKHQYAIELVQATTYINPFQVL